MDFNLMMLNKYKFVILIFVLMMPFVVAEISTSLGGNYLLGQTINLGGSCNAPSISVAFQIISGGTTVWFDQTLTQGDKTFKSVFTPTAEGNYSLYLSCGGEKKNVNFCVGKSCTTTTSGCQESWNCSGWSECKNGTQTKTCTDKNNCNTNISKPPLQQICGQDSGSPPGGGGGGGGCIPNFECDAWSYCNISLKQTRTCSDTTYCKPYYIDVKNCTKCDESWTCSIWSACSYGTQDRKCTDLHVCGTTQFKPVEQKGCQQVAAPVQPQQTYTPPPEPGIVADLKQMIVTGEAKPFWDSYKYYIIGLSVFVVLAIIIVVLILYLHKPKRVYNLDELKEWVVKERQMGTSDNDIKTILAQHTKWKEPEIRQVFSGLRA